jgi:hypothetical protein
VTTGQSEAGQKRQRLRVRCLGERRVLIRDAHHLANIAIEVPMGPLDRFVFHQIKGAHFAAASFGFRNFLLTGETVGAAEFQARQCRAAGLGFARFRSLGREQAPRSILPIGFVQRLPSPARITKAGSVGGGARAAWAGRAH